MVDLSKQLLFFLLKLGNLLLKFVGIHAFSTQVFHVLMNSTELSLQISVDLHSVAHIFIDHKFIRDLQRHQETGCVSFAWKIRQASQHPEKNMLQGALLTMDNITAEVRVVIRRIAQHFEETTDALLGLVLRLLLQVDLFVSSLVQVWKNFVYEFKKLKGRLIIELHHRKVLHKRRTVQTVYNLLDLICAQARWLRENLGLVTVVKSGVAYKVESKLDANVHW